MTELGQPADAAQLAVVLADFARTMVTDFPIQAILEALAGRVVTVLPVVAAGVTLISPDASPIGLAASSAAGLRFEGLQSELGEGPCIDAFLSGEPVGVGDLRISDGRYPLFCARGRRAGLGAVFAFPLRHDEARLGALDLYCSKPTRLSPTAMFAAQTLADVAAAYILNARARDDLRAAADQARALARRDELTGLGNRAQMLEDLGRALRRACRPGHTVAVLFADLDRFKQINDVHGHRVGDELLVAVAARLLSVVRPGDSLGRPAGDEFVVICDDLATASDAGLLADRVTAALAEPFELDHSVVVTATASVGVAFTTRGGVSPSDILHAADQAMYQAKRRSGHAHHLVTIEGPDAGVPTAAARVSVSGGSDEGRHGSARRNPHAQEPGDTRGLTWPGPRQAVGP